VRFDRVRFQAWKSSRESTLYRGEIYSLWGASDDSLWVGSNLGLARLKGGKVTTTCVDHLFGPSPRIETATSGSRSLTQDPRPPVRSGRAWTALLWLG
jgi:hypothetical protein